MRRPRILLADDHRIVAEGLRSLIEPEFELVGIVEDGRAMVDAAEKLQHDVIVADISMTLLNGIEAPRQIRKTNKAVRVIFLTMHPDVTYAVSAFEAARGQLTPVRRIRRTMTVPAAAAAAASTATV